MLRKILNLAFFRTLIFFAPFLDQVLDIFEFNSVTDNFEDVISQAEPVFLYETRFLDQVWVLSYLKYRLAHQGRITDQTISFFNSF
jgi:hypothetical protein